VTSGAGLTILEVRICSAARAACQPIMGLESRCR
jgi:hypothetical protein